MESHLDWSRYTDYPLAPSVRLRGWLIYWCFQFHVSSLKSETSAQHLWHIWQWQKLFCLNQSVARSRLVSLWPKWRHPAQLGRWWWGLPKFLLSGRGCVLLSMNKCGLWFHIVSHLVILQTPGNMWVVWRASFQSCTAINWPHFIYD